ncbi:MAG: SDR family NAD(P)-dependent oxidoreductase [Labilithrix sp.]|nr:SDR family NAD(P)-dependent oxidoreductase [Labilithrix sp.]MCW5835561.1 SDR family NAD(P)-dependent oxidoreductase [Labilithrix sp.]
MRNKIDGAVVVLTGASSGVGRVTATMFARRNAKLVLAARATDALREVVRRCVGLGAEAIAVPTDVRDESQVLALRDAAVARFGRIDVWVNDAASYLVGNLEDVPSELVRGLFETNVVGTFNGAKAALTQFRKQGRGTLISLGSIAGRAPYAKASAYCASKHAVHAMNAALRQELLGTRIDACVVAPAMVDTPLFDHAANYTGLEMRVKPTVDSPRRVAHAILRCAERPRREVFVGGAPILTTLLHLFLPWLYEHVQADLIARPRLGPLPAPKIPGNIPETLPPYAVDGGWRRGRESVLEPRAAASERTPLVTAEVAE